METPEVGPWAREKLQALEGYLNFYTTALKNQRWLAGTTFVDAFAGAGHARIRRATSDPSMDSLLNASASEIAEVDSAAREYVRGSPRVALEIENRFSRYVFIERDPNRADELHRMREEYGPSFQIQIRQGEAHEELLSLISTELSQPRHRSVVFLDPFGMQIPWDVIHRLGATGQVEVIINFALGMAIQRMLARSATFQPGWREALNRFFGSPDWHQQVYEERRDLLGTTVHKREDAGKRLLVWYRRRLEQAFGHVSSARLIKNTRGAHLYYLIWAGPNILGLKGANYILKNGETIR